MAIAYENYTLDKVKLSNDSQLISRFVEGQKLALNDIGVTDEEVGAVQVAETPGTYAVIARGQSGEVIGGLRIHTRLEGAPLPLESDGSPLTWMARTRLQLEPAICEVSGLWVAPHAAGRFMSRKIVALGVAFGYELGAASVVGLSHSRAFRFVTEPLGFEMDQNIPPMAYPDDRFQTFVVWHRAGLAEIEKTLEPRGLKVALDERSSKTRSEKLK